MRFRYYWYLLCNATYYVFDNMAQHIFQNILMSVRASNANNIGDKAQSSGAPRPSSKQSSVNKSPTEGTKMALATDKRPAKRPELQTADVRPTKISGNRPSTDRPPPPTHRPPAPGEIREKVSMRVVAFLEKKGGKANKHPTITA